MFLSRTAQRVPYMSSTHMLRLLGVMVLTVGWFLSAWTASVLQNRERNIPLLVTSSTPEGKSFSLCDLDRWDYMMAVGELRARQQSHASHPKSWPAFTLCQAVVCGKFVKNIGRLIMYMDKEI